MHLKSGHFILVPFYLSLVNQNDNTKFLTFICYKIPYCLLYGKLSKPTSLFIMMKVSSQCLSIA